MSGRIVFQQKPLILLVEEDKTARALMALVLSSQGYGVLESPSLVDVEGLWQENLEQVAVVVVGLITDTSVRLRLLQMFVKHRPDIKVVIASGYDRSLVTNVIDLEGCWFIPKPVQRETVLGMVGKIMMYKVRPDLLKKKKDQSDNS
ncbi:MAG: hybrid sensor histidine kinase/response regulator [Verrucomicrobiales bacterium]|nr:hybrid sensor histidine kinase/response regulator [Verrucomicrobiales bacterium]